MAWFRWILVSLVCLPAHASLLFYFEAYGVQTTQVAGARQYTFDNLTTGTLLNSVNANFGGGITGTYTNIYISTPNAFGGSNQTNYMAIGAQSGTTTASVTFNQNLKYFGFYWSAIDNLNTLSFYNGTTLVATLTAAQLAASLNSSYFCNPNNNQDCGEKFAFINFYATGSTVFNRIVISNGNTSTGFENDTHAVRTTLPPTFNGTFGGDITVPEPPTLGVTGAALILASLLARRLNRIRRRPPPVAATSVPS